MTGNCNIITEILLVISYTTIYCKKVILLLLLLVSSCCPTLMVTWKAMIHAWMKDVREKKLILKSYCIYTYR